MIILNASLWEQVMWTPSRFGGTTVVLIGKNTMIHKATHRHLENNSTLEKLLPHIQGNTGFVFIKEALAAASEILIKTGDKVGARKATLLNMLNIVPFFGLIIQQVFNHNDIYNSKVPIIVASVCLNIGYGTVASVPHSIINGHKWVLTVETEYTFSLTEKVKAFLPDPSVFVAPFTVVLPLPPPLLLLLL
ncbi:hypothetical protein A6R68_05092, partial [Neotoma lepida]